MTANINLEDYEIDTDSNGNLVVRDPNDNIVMTHVVGSGWSLGGESVGEIKSINAEEHQIVDADGNVVGSLSAESDGTLKLQEGTSGADNEIALNTDGSVGFDTISEFSLPDRYIIYERSGTFIGHDAVAQSDEFSSPDVGEVVNSALGDITRGTVKLTSFRTTAMDTPIRLKSGQKQVVGAGNGTILAPGPNFPQGEPLIDVGADAGDPLQDFMGVSSLTVQSGPNGSRMGGGIRYSNARGGLFYGLRGSFPEGYFIQLDDGRGQAYTAEVIGCQARMASGTAINIDASSTGRANRNRIAYGVLQGGDYGVRIGDGANTNALMALDVGNNSTEDLSISGDKNRTAFCDFEGGGEVTVTTDGERNEFVSCGFFSGLTDNGTQTRFDGSQFQPSAPSGSNYGASDSGTLILDTSSTPADQYVVAPDGSLLGPL